MMPLPEDVAAYSGHPGQATTLAAAQEHLPVAKVMVRAYTRGRGFDLDDEPNDELAAVILTSAARSIQNPQSLRSQAVDDFTVSYQIVSGWTLAELAVLNRYRTRAM